ncbi:hypothetical protein CPBF1521_42720 [Xanthomonas arboricola pv. juglandis]|nr:hypothetical protein CPBF1521_42720 [Xanthomonas arboricola pv. juglandis]SYZ61443.1 hypothetical protein CPBF427_36300 [Xanthomonas arboricola pv. juglandis]
MFGSNPAHSPISHPLLNSGRELFDVIVTLHGARLAGTLCQLKLRLLERSEPGLQLRSAVLEFLFSKQLGNCLAPLCRVVNRDKKTRVRDAVERYLPQRTSVLLEKLCKWRVHGRARYLVSCASEERFYSGCFDRCEGHQSEVNLGASRNSPSFLAVGQTRSEVDCRSRQECLHPGCPYFRLEAWSADYPRAVGWVGHSGPFELVPASCRAAGRQASARAKS